MKKGLALPILAFLALSYLAIQTSFKTKSREKLDDVINSEYQEARPLISGDGQTLYFVRRHHPDNLGGTADFQDIWMARNIDGNWAQPINLSTPVNNKKSNTLCSITEDGKVGLFLDSYRGVKTPLSKAELTADGWQKPKPVEIQNFVNLSSYYDFHHHETRGVLLMAINNGRGSGDQDLHVSFLQKDGTYSAPINLGAVVNSRQADFAPFLAADGKTLFYASFGHKGKGGSDLYVSRRLDDSWRKWSLPVNLGSVINSELDENYISVTADLKWAYFESYPTGSPEKDIYRAPLNLDQLLEPTRDPLITEHDQNLEASPMAQQDQTLDKPLTQAQNPSLEPIAPAQSEPAVVTSAPNQRPVPKSDSHTKPVAESSNSSLLKSNLDAGVVQSKVLNNVYFASNSTALPAHFRPILDQVYQILSERPQMQAFIEGHTDDQGPAELNLRISHLRAQTAAHYVLDQGVHADRIHIVGKGETEPLASNDDETEGRELNRRVEITLSDGAGANLYFVLR